MLPTGSGPLCRVVKHRRQGRIAAPRTAFRRTADLGVVGRLLPIGPGQIQQSSNLPDKMIVRNHPSQAELVKQLSLALATPPIIIRPIANRAPGNRNHAPRLFQAASATLSAPKRPSIEPADCRLAGAKVTLSRRCRIAAVDPNETPAVEAAPYPRPPSGCFFHSRRLSPSWPTVRHGVCRHHRVVRCELDTQMRSRAPSSVSWSTTIRCRLSSGRVRQALRVHVPITALEVRPEGTGMDVDGRR
jgi:hypothetical protein